ncbi:hypothetical protein [Agrobacterium larrymoorei]|uniref:DUF4760 domain-containing protein n=1 Tax=Agrobacterium larrymoorei TaxID=160699 RepID=A0ABU0UKA4_9HYPH|nr:hypothetical protein [Agrobacterium larrymoorei]MDQ1185370.1 hypothetical protein [Agrobacterium larrymoorei]
MISINWDMVSALANVVMAITAVVAAAYALLQYRASTRIQELEQINSIYKSTVDVMSKASTGKLGFAEIKLVIDHLELQERRIENGLLTKRAVEFYRDAMSINDQFVDIPDENLKVIRAVLTADLRGYRHIIKALKKNSKTSYIIDW